MAVWASLEFVPLPDEPRALPLAILIDVGYVGTRRVGRIRAAPLAYLGNSRWQFTPEFRIELSFEEPAVSRQPATPSLLDAVLISG